MVPRALLSATFFFLSARVAGEIDPWKGPTHIFTHYRPLWPHALPCYCYTNVYEVYKPISEWVMSSTNFSWLVQAFENAGVDVKELDRPNMTMFLPVQGGGDLGGADQLRKWARKHIVTGNLQLSMADFDFGTSRLMMQDGNYIYVHKDFYCYLTIRKDDRERMEYRNTDDVMANDVMVILPDIKCDNGMIHIISEPVPPNT